MKTYRQFQGFLKAAAAIIILTGIAVLATADDGDDTLVAKLKDSKQSLADGIAQCEKENGSAISAKFELEDGKLSLSVYTAKAGLEKDAEHNVLMEIAGDPTQDIWKPETEVFVDKKHLTRSAMQLALVQVSKVTLAGAIKKAETAQPGTVYSITPAVKDGNPVFQIKVSTAAGKSVSIFVDGRTGEVGK